MPNINLLNISQRSEDGQIVIATEIRHPLLVVDLLLTAAKTYVAHAGKTMEPKPQILEPASNIVT